MNEKIPVSEVFLWLQGEWPNTGKPTIFVRFFWCNLNCKWCDSKYATKGKEYEMMTIQDIKNEIEKINCNSVTFTWWEPWLYSKEISELIGWLSYDLWVYIETNGSKGLDKTFVDWISVSPKLKNSGNKEYDLRVMPWKKIIYKFVVWVIDDFEEIDKYVYKYNIPRDSVWIMPEWITKESQLRPRIAEETLSRRYNLSLRQHVLLYDNKRWV